VSGDAGSPGPRGKMHLGVGIVLGAITFVTWQKGAITTKGGIAFSFILSFRSSGAAR
jgi:hypothetical protein